MTSEEVFLTVLDAMRDLQIPYMVVGSFSSNFYGISRSTNDADLVVSLGSSSIGKIAQRLGTEFHLDPQARFETITATTKYVFDLPHIPFTVEFFLLSDDPHDQERFRRRLPVQLLGHDAWLPTAEDVVIMKLRWAASRKKGKDSDDICNVIGVSGHLLDWSYIYSWCDHHGTRELLDSLRASIPEG
jgi:hypothetical protein